MKTLSILSTLLLASIVGLACDTPNKSQAEADHARQEAEEKANKAQAELNQQTQQAQAEVDRKQQQANITLMTTKNDYHARLSDVLANADKRVADLRAEDLTAPAATKTKNEDIISKIAQRHMTLEADMRQIDTTTAADWDRVKDQVDKDISDMKTYLPTFAGKT